MLGVKTRALCKLSERSTAEWHPQLHTQVPVTPDPVNPVG